MPDGKRGQLIWPWLSRVGRSVGLLLLLSGGSGGGWHLAGWFDRASPSHLVLSSMDSLARQQRQPSAEPSPPAEPAANLVAEVAQATEPDLDGSLIPVPGTSLPEESDADSSALVVEAEVTAPLPVPPELVVLDPRDRSIVPPAISAQAEPLGHVLVADTRVTPTAGRLANLTRGRLAAYLTSSSDTLEALAERFRVSIATLRLLNDLEAEADVKEGQVLRIPLVDGPAYRVSPGDTLSHIAVRHGVEQQSVVDANALESDLILPGQVLLIPDGVPPADPPATPTEVPTVRAAPTNTPRPRPSATSTPANRPTTLTALAQPTAQPTPTRRATSTPPTAARAAAEPASSARTDRPSFAWPVNGALSQHFGTNGHEGIDVAAPQGAVVRAAGPGRVTVAAKLSYGYGWRIKIDHGGGYITLYAHLSSFAVAEGDRVGRGQVIGAVGRTGQATGPHLHFEVLLNGHPVNPLKQLP